MKFTHARRLLIASLLPLSTFSLLAANAPAANTQPSTPAQAAQNESVKRQELIFSANQAINDGQKLLSNAQYDDAAARYQYALDNLTPGGTSAALYNKAAAGLAAAKAGQAQDFAKQAKFAQAAALLQESINLQPKEHVYVEDLEDLKKQQIAYEQQVRDPEGVVNNPAVTQEFKEKVATVQKLLVQGDDYFKTGQYDKAEDTYSKILILDPYNNAARNAMAHMEKYKERADNARHKEYEQEQLNNVASRWTESISTDLVVSPSTNPQLNTYTNRAKITRKLQSIIIDKVNFDKLDISTVIQFLQDKSKELDVPDHQGVNFVLRLSSNTPPVDPNAAPGATPGAAPAAAPAAAAGATPGAPAADATPRAIHREVSITLDNVPLGELLNYITGQTNLQFSVEDYAVYLRPNIDEGETLTVRTFLVPANFFTGRVAAPAANAPQGGGIGSIENVSVKVTDELASKGISFPSGATATFLPGSSKLVVRNTPEQLDLIGNLIENQSNKETPQVQIESKLAEFNQDVIKALTFNYQVGTALINGAPLGVFLNGAQTALRTPDLATLSGNGGLLPNNIDSLIRLNQGATVLPINPVTGNAVSPNDSTLFFMGGIVDGVGLAAIINAMNNTTGVSLLSAPSVTTQRGQTASVAFIREFPYPTSFDKPKLGTTPVAYTSGDFAGQPLTLAIPPTPREFKEEDVGVTFEVKPTTYPDQRIDLDITKCQVVDFDGFINYGVPITTRLFNVPLTDTSPIPELSPGVINQPVFNIRSVVTKLQVLDGQTAVLGGLIREDTQEINDKVPVLGDLPWVGRLFQSKISERVKKDLLIFVTARLVRPNGKPQYIKTLSAEPEEEKLPEPDQQIGAGVTLPLLPEGTPNS